MRIRFVFLILLVCLCSGNTLLAREEYPVCTYKYFSKGKVSTSACYDKNGRFGEATAYNRKGAIIYKKSLRKFAGGSHVVFSYYDDGAVSKAEWHEAPDGGIQWYSSVTWFLKDGKIEKVSEQSYDDHSRITTIRKDKLPPQEKQTPSKVTPSETMKCAAIYSSEFWYINETHYPVIVTTEKTYNPDGQFTTVLKPGDTTKGGQLILAEQFDYPDKYYHFIANPERETSTRKFIINRSGIAPHNAKKEVRRYYYTVEEAMHTH